MDQEKLVITNLASTNETLEEEEDGFDLNWEPEKPAEKKSPEEDFNLLQINPVRFYLCYWYCWKRYQWFRRNNSEYKKVFHKYSEIVSGILDQIVKKTPGKQPSGEQHPVELTLQCKLKEKNLKKINDFYPSKHTLCK